MDYLAVHERLADLNHRWSLWIRFVKRLFQRVFGNVYKRLDAGLLTRPGEEQHRQVR